jgi:hypothetical protein
MSFALAKASFSSKNSLSSNFETKSEVFEFLEISLRFSFVFEKSSSSEEE